MNKEKLKEILNLYKSTENSITKLNDEFGICLWNAKNNNFYNNYNFIIHKLFIEIFSEDKVNLIESYLFDETDMSFDELYNLINNGNKT